MLCASPNVVNYLNSTPNKPNVCLRDNDIVVPIVYGYAGSGRTAFVIIATRHRRIVLVSNGSFEHYCLITTTNTFEIHYVSYHNNIVASVKGPLAQI